MQHREGHRIGRSASPHRVIGPVRWALLLLFAVVLHPALAASAEAIRILDRVFLVPDSAGSPTEFQMIVNAGCAEEARGDCRGLAHYLEHLVLVGRNPENKDAAVRFFPEAASNGWTTSRATAFTHRIPARPEGPKADLEKLFAFYAARLDDFAITPEEALRERNVVLQEHDLRYGSSPFAQFVRRLDRALLPDHPLGQAVIGSRESIQSLTLDDAHAFHRAWYHRGNVWFVIKGDIAPETLKAVAEAALAKAGPRLTPERLADRMPDIAPDRLRIEAEDAKLERASVFFRKLVVIDENDAYAGAAARLLLSNFIGSQFPGSLQDALVERAKLVRGAPGFQLYRLLPGLLLLSVSAEAAPNVDPARVGDAIAAYIAGLGAIEIPDATLARLKRRFADERMASDRQQAQVYQRLIGWIAARLDPDEIARQPERIAAVGRPDIAAILARLAAPGRSVTGILAPATKGAQP